ncbi:MAG: hypothetical protein ACLUEK_03080 [Oscillospiraceae bacterium]
MLLLQLLAMPWLAQRQIQEVDYGTFMDMAAKQELGQVEVQEEDNQILFTDKDETTIYKTGMMPDPTSPSALRTPAPSSPGRSSSRRTRYSPSSSAGYCPSSSLWASVS